MGKSWTVEQQQVINLRERSLLVSAAAGSGKTAVLVERIIQKITDDTHPMDIDQLLVVTFTRAAAAEMRERVMEAVEKRLEADPENAHLQKQKMLLPSAQITTIDSFCMGVIREHFDVIGLDPGFRVGDPQEIILLKQDVARQLLDDCYEEEMPGFIRFVETYSSGKLDGGITDWILKLYDFSQSHPWPEEWLEEALRMHPGSGAVDFEESQLMELIMEESSMMLEECVEVLRKALMLSCRNDGPGHYTEVLAEDLEQVEAMAAWEIYSDLFEQMEVHTWKKLPGKKQPDADKLLIEKTKKFRQEAKDLIAALKKAYFMDPLDIMLAKEKMIFPGIVVLLEITKEFSKRFQQEKQARNLIDFNDQEHLALNILLDENHEPTATAESYSELFEEIMCDEYQDSNQVQETLLNSISRERKGQPNLFMVGDVKQSIYRFRMADPQIFLGKYQQYRKEEATHQRIDLHKNFRSRENVLSAINCVFEKLMTPQICGMVYDEDAALYPGLEYPETSYPVSKFSEWILAEQGGSKEMTKKESEAWAIGKRIRELTDPISGITIMDPDTGIYRTAEYGDIVILLRTVKNWTEDYVRVLKDMGIPAIGETSSGFFDTLEIQGILNLLRVLDNPLQDIPMAAVLRSPIGDFTNEELAKIRLDERSIYLYENMKHYMSDGEENVICEKLSNFEALYEDLRKRKVHITIEELIHEIYERTGYVQQMLALPGGEVRQANLERLVEYAKDFQKTSYRGLFHFIRYVDQLKEAKEDIGEAILPGDAGKAVRIMSIHKSKGLEYPICFVAGLGKKMNFRESRSRIVVHAGYGVAADGVDLENRVKIRSMYKNLIARKMLQEQMGEEIRVLYVAMTRAREKLILVGSVDNMEQMAEKWGVDGAGSNPSSYSRMLRATSYLDWLGPLFFSDGQAGANHGFVFRCLNSAHRTAEEIREEIRQDEEREFFKACEKISDEHQELYEEISDGLSWSYPKEIMTRLQGKMTVSELKKMAGEEMPGQILYPEREPRVEKSLDDSLYMAQQKGTATHKIFELLPFDKITASKDISDFIHQCVEKEQIPGFWEKLIPVEEVFNFCQSDLGQRMARALERGQLYRERPFVMGIPVSEVYPDLKETENILIQGVIDVYFEEEDGIVLLDYKTDRIPGGEAGDKVLIKRYKTQLDYYQRAIEQISGKKVKDRILYSVIMNREIHC